MNVEEITRIIEKASLSGVEIIEVDGLKVVFKRKPHRPQVINDDKPLSYQSNPSLTLTEKPFVPDKKPEELIKPLSPLDDLSPEEILYYATPRYDEIQAEKEAHKEKLAGEAERDSVCG